LNNFIVYDGRSGGDLAIAAVAIAARMVIVTGNADDFVEIAAPFPLPGLFEPFAMEWMIDPPAGVALPR